ncbi:DnaJ domain-containing protein [Varunaivibrio sulfuroxidans]|uniref:DnaJ-like protein n=1 Tax=Varunaivibrio sulfuroxidans TaxID=1773489 RepID=A0A4R3J775_9PROT|nr:DnaJ domain-containing protein [Varunaivibrio sulfuroxidans]TCS61267.1 DnaJ-like protein [Varunaivibrio sulfuroxidans]WES31114.1 DnaJ domain-containing protein [Varunaivibrio sulfuroxidans]
MPYLILGLTLALGLFLLGRWFISADPKDLFKVLKIAVALVGLTIIIVLAVSGRLLWALAALPAVLIWLMRLFGAFRAVKSFAGGREKKSEEKNSEIETSYLRMQLDHLTGRMHGVVLAGAYRGRALDTLPLEALLKLLGTLRVDDLDSARLLESYLERAHPDWRDHNEDGYGNDGAARTGEMARGEALKVLGLEETASAEEIKAAYRRLMANLHPDHGGSSYLAAQINRAKDVLLGDQD